MDVDADAAARPAAPAAAVHPGAIMVPWAAVIVAASDSDVGDTARETELKARCDQGEEEELGDVFHGRLAGLRLLVYSTTPTVPPEGSAMTAKRLP
jgi:hypothetical protein